MNRRRHARVCAQCEVDFVAATPRAKFCSKLCRGRAEQDRLKPERDPFNQRWLPEVLPPDIFPPDRVCSFSRDGLRCITRLCRYNPGPECYVHQQQGRAEYELSTVQVMTEATGVAA